MLSNKYAFANIEPTSNYFSTTWKKKSKKKISRLGEKNTSFFYIRTRKVNGSRKRDMLKYKKNYTKLYI